MTQYNWTPIRLVKKINKLLTRLRDYIMYHIEAKLLVLILSLSLIPFLILGGFLYYQQTKIKLVDLHNSLSTVAKIGAYNIDDWYNVHIRQLQDLASNSQIIAATKKIVSKKSTAEQKFSAELFLKDQLGVWTQGNNWLKEFVISRPSDGRVMFQTGIAFPWTTLSEQPHFKEAILGSIGLTGIVPSIESIKDEHGNYHVNVPTQFISIPLRGDAGLVGVLTARLNVFIVDAAISAYVKQYHSIDTYIVDENGVFLSKPLYMDRLLSLDRIKVRPELELHLTSPDTSAPTPLFKKIQTTQEDIPFLEFGAEKVAISELSPYPNYVGEPVVGAAARIGRLHWYFVSEISADEAFSQLRFIQFFLLASMLILLFFLVGVSILLSKTLTRSIKILTAGATEVANGRLSHRINFEKPIKQSRFMRTFFPLTSRLIRHAQDEIDTLGTVFNQMLDHLEVSIQQLELSKKDLSEKADALGKSNRYKTQFLAKVSHELRTPLNSMLVLSKLLFENKSLNLTEKQVEYAKTIYASGSELLVLINDILDFSKLEITQGQIKTTIEKITVADIKDYVQTHFGHVAAAKGLRLKTELNASAPEFMYTDSVRIHQILKNLLANACKFTPEGGEVSLMIGGVGSEVTFAVRDTGIGIAPDQQAAVFEAFSQADGSITRKFGGTGLGLTICLQLGGLLGGKIELESDLGNGSTFTLRLPVKREGDDCIESESEPKSMPEAAPVIVTPDILQLPLEPGIPVQNDSVSAHSHGFFQSSADPLPQDLFSGKTVIIVEPNIRYLFVFTGFLEERAITVISAKTLDDLQKILAEQTDRLPLFVDCDDRMLIALSGNVQLLSLLKQRAWTLIYSGGQPTDHLGATYVLSKPVDPSAVLKIILE